MRTKYFIERKSFTGRFATILMILAIPFLVAGRWNDLKTLDYSNVALIVAIALPLLGCLLHILDILVFGRKLFWTSFIPVTICMATILLGAFTKRSLIAYGEMFLCFLIAVIYTCTVFGAIKSKLFVAILFIIHIAFRGYFWIYPDIVSGNPIGLTTAFYEIAILFILFGFLMTSLGLKKENKVDVETGKDVIPPIPGVDAINGQNPVASEKEPEAEAPAEAPKEEPKEEPAAPETAVEESKPKKSLAERFGKGKKDAEKLVDDINADVEKINNELHDLKDSAEEIGTFKGEEDK